MTTESGGAVTGVVVVGDGVGADVGVVLGNDLMVGSDVVGLDADGGAVVVTSMLGPVVDVVDVGLVELGDVVDVVRWCAEDDAWGVPVLPHAASVIAPASTRPP